MSVLSRILLALVALLLVQTSVAGPIFEIRSNGSSAPYALSNNWGITSTGAGGMVGSLVFRDGFSLFHGASFSAADIVSLTYSHQVVPTGGAFITPAFSFTANASQIVSATGLVSQNGAGFSLHSAFLDIQTSVAASQFVNFGSGFAGIFEGDWFVRGISAGFNDTTSTVTSPLQGNPFLVNLSTASGNWEFTGQSTAATPEPGMMTLLGMGLLGLIGMRRSAVSS